MKNKKKIKIAITSLLIVFTVIIESVVFPMKVSAEEHEYQGYTLDDSFIPTRSFYPYYLSVYSGFESNVIKGIWEKLFIEQHYNPNWSKGVSEGGYYVDSSTDYVALGGVSKSYYGIDFAFDTKDFDAFFGNSLLSNSELLGEMLSLAGYEPVTSKSGIYSDSEIQTILKNIIYTKMSQPETYTYFSKAMLDLTKSGAYIGAGEKAADNQLTTASINGQTFDIWMLKCLAYYYEGDGDETYLSTEQLKWLTSYQLTLYDAFTTGNNPSLKAMVESYAPLKDLIARSTYAANDRNGYGQYFFNYVVESKRGAGAWLNMNDNVSIEGLDAINDISMLFHSSNGFCGGLCNEAPTSAHYCTVRANCEDKATPSDILAYKVYKNFSAMRYVIGNTVTNTAYQGGADSWKTRHDVRHNGAGKAMPASYTVGIGAAYQEGGVQNFPWSFDGTNMYTIECWCWMNTHINSSAFLSNASTITTYINTNWGNSQDGTYQIGGYSATTIVNGQTRNITNKIGWTFNQGWQNAAITMDISNLSYEERQNAHVVITSSCKSDYLVNNSGQGPGSGTVMPRMWTNPTVNVACKYPKCTLEDHNWKLNPSQSNWGNDYSTATLAFFCDYDSAHSFQDEHPIITKTEDSNSIIYTATSPYLYIDGKNPSITKRISKTPGTTSQTIAFDGSNSYGSRTASAVSTTTIYSAGTGMAGWFSYGHEQNVYKTATANAKISVKAGLILPGAKSVSVNVFGSQQVKSVEAAVYSSSGRLIGHSIHTPGNNGPYANGNLTVSLETATDQMLEDSYIIISASSYSKTVAPAVYVEPADAHTWIGINSMTVNY